ncbi:hypothetical protein B0T22DRAFT_80514 [Podospora appendiculata]|uniref:Uncharacterized protein n=1 Tax=Podospora appendiculata TaxID=314037 RepID=A0AAE1CHE7_9PEZI|nr:hypothetical protein B0T22DRAFT_80514 [Podospora appendiculata]
MLGPNERWSVLTHTPRTRNKQRRDHVSQGQLTPRNFGDPRYQMPWRHDGQGACTRDRHRKSQPLHTAPESERWIPCVKEKDSREPWCGMCGMGGGNRSFAHHGTVFPKNLGVGKRALSFKTCSMLDRHHDASAPNCLGGPYSDPGCECLRQCIHPSSSPPPEHPGLTASRFHLSLAVGREQPIGLEFRYQTQRNKTAPNHVCLEKIR